MARHLIVPDVCRFAVNQHWSNGRKVVNVLDMRIFNENLTTTRNEAIEDQAEIISNRWSVDVFAHLANNLVMETVSWVDLNSSSGSTGSVAFESGDTGAEPTDQAYQPNTAFLVSKVIGGHARGARNGRMYLAGMHEGQSADDGSLVISDVQTDLDSFFGNINQDNGLTDPAYTSRLCVVHLGPKPAGPDDDWPGTSSDVTQLVVQPVAATQRRRLRG